MQGIRVTDIQYSKEKLLVRWDYSGRLDIKPEVLFCEPAPRNREDVANFILGAFLPLLTMAGEGVTLPDNCPVSEDSLSFWRSKLRSLFSEDIFNQSGYVPKVQPITQDHVFNYEGNRIALMWGGGADSSLAAAQLVLERKLKPILVHAQRAEAGWTADGMFQTCLKEIAAYLGVEYRVILTNAPDVQRNTWNTCAPFLNHRNLWNWGCVLAPHSRRSTSHVSSGTPLFFAALGALPANVTRILMAGAADDPWEPYFYGMDFWNDRAYRGVKMIGHCSATKVEEYDLLFGKYPDVAAWVKPCWDDTVQWCGKCKKCREAALMLEACHREPPFEATEGINRVPGLLKVGRLLAALYHYRSQPGRKYETEKKLSRAVYETALVLSERTDEWYTK